MSMKLGMLLVTLFSFATGAAGQLGRDMKVNLPALIKSVEIVGGRLRISPNEPMVKLSASVTGGMEVTAAVTLNAAAPSDGVWITLASNNSAVANPPASIRIAGGSTRDTVAFLTNPVTAPTTVTLTASRNVPGDSKSVIFTVVPTALVGFTVDETAVAGGKSVAGHVRFSGPPPPSPAVQAMLKSSDSTVATVPYSVTLPQSRTIVDVTIQTKGQVDSKQVNITASYGGREQSAALTVQETKLKQLGNTNADGSNGFGYAAPPPVVIPVFLTGAAPQGGVTVNLTTNDQQKFPVPSSMTIAAGQDHGPVSVNFPVSATTGTATITATYKGVTKSLSFSLVPPDIRFASVQFVDRLNNVITKPQDSQPFNVCAKLNKSLLMGSTNTTLGVAYVTHTGGPTSTGREFEVPATFPASYGWEVTVCALLPGLEPGQWHDVTLKADSKNVVEESNETNNTFQAKITR